MSHWGSPWKERKINFGDNFDVFLLPETFRHLQAIYPQVSRTDAKIFLALPASLGILASSLRWSYYPLPFLFPHQPLTPLGISPPETGPGKAATACKALTSNDHGQWAIQAAVVSIPGPSGQLSKLEIYLSGTERGDKKIYIFKYFNFKKSYEWHVLQKIQIM